MQLGEDLLVDTCVFIDLTAVDHDKTIAQFALHDGMHYGIEEVLHVSVFGQVGVQQPYRKRPRAFERLQQFLIRVVGCPQPKCASALNGTQYKPAQLIVTKAVPISRRS